MFEVDVLSPVRGHMEILQHGRAVPHTVGRWTGSGGRRHPLLESFSVTFVHRSLVNVWLPIVLEDCGLQVPIQSLRVPSCVCAPWACAQTR